jgi:hypothetical protein
LVWQNDCQHRQQTISEKSSSWSFVRLPVHNYRNKQNMVVIVVIQPNSDDNFLSRE